MKAKIMSVALALCQCASGAALAKNDKDKPLPAGLQKKESQGQSLPPGWQKKLAVGTVLDKAVYDQAEIVVKDVGSGLLTIKVEGKLIKLMQNSLEIVDILNDE